MARFKLAIIESPDPKKKAIFKTGKVGVMGQAWPVFIGEDAGKGPDDYVCGACGAVILQHVWSDDQFNGLVFQCSGCGKFNSITSKSTN